MFTVKFIFSFSFVLQLLLDIGHYNFQFFILFKVMYRRDVAAESMSPSHLSMVIFFPISKANLNNNI